MQVRRVIPLLRNFDVSKMGEFYLGFLGCTIDWQHGGEAAGAPIYLQVSRGALRLHLSVHHGDACPGARVYIEATGLAELHAELTAKQYRFNRPGLQSTPWGTRELEVHAPFGNRLTFAEHTES